MRLVNMLTDAGPRLGVVRPEGIVDATRLDPTLTSVDDLLAHPERLAALAEVEGPPLAGRHLPAVLRPEKIICVGRNYRLHAAETGSEVPAFPCLFAKFRPALTGHGSVVRPPAMVRQLDYEGELAVIIGVGGRDIPESEALRHVFGYTVANDLSARDLQFRTPQWLSGKTPDGFCPLGPALVTADEVPDPQALTIRTRVNGELVQDGRTADMVYGVAHLVAYISSIVTLTPGDVILTGTPDGVQLGKADPRWLVAGDEVAVEIEGIGTLVTTIGQPLGA
jgi:2-keto-4-pentenoate hydratase/2-oxohepta-3-ene-1,7-dioic acid hydratase in catechol pathway